jgi:hypothetical protein
MKTFYNLWFYDSSVDHHAIYYNVKHKKYMWINGSDHHQLEVCIPERSEPIMGIDPALRANVIRQTIMDINTVEVEFDILQ